MDLFFGCLFCLLVFSALGLPTKKGKIVMLNARWSAFWLSLCTLLAVACGPAVGDGVLVLRVSSGFAVGEVDRISLVWTVAGEALEPSEFELGVSAGKLQLPAEFRLTDVGSGVDVQAVLTGYARSSDGQSESVVVRRSFRTQGVAGQTLMYLVHLDGQCGLYPNDAEKQSGPSCNDPLETCIVGTCRSSEVPSSALLPYGAPVKDDVCKEAGGGAPLVVVGEGQSDFLFQDDYDEAQVEAGPQGGHHIWVAVRTINLSQSGVITTVGGEVPSLNLSISPLKVIFTMEPDEGGYCKLYGLRFQIDIDGGPIESLLGEQLKVLVTMADQDGVEASAERWVTLSETIR
jgi:hypothetical protein